MGVRTLARARFFFLFIVGGFEQFKVFCLVHCVALQATEIVNSVPPINKFRSAVLTTGHNCF